MSRLPNITISIYDETGKEQNEIQVSSLYQELIMFNWWWVEGHLWEEFNEIMEFNV